MAGKKQRNKKRGKKTAGSDSRHRSSPFFNSNTAYIVIALTAFLLYMFSITSNYVVFDDYKILVTEQSGISGTEHIPDAFSDTFGNLYRPVLKISFIIDNLLSGGSVGFYHFTSILWHVLSALLLLFFLRKIKINEKAAFFFALIFAVHPALVQAVAWIPGRNDSMLTVFVLLSFIFLIQSQSKNHLLFIFLSLFSFAAAVFTKETAVLLPALLLVFIFINNKKINKTQLVILITGWLAILLVWYFMRSAALESVVSKDKTGIGIFLSNIISLPAMTGKIFLPISLSGLAVTDQLTTLLGIISLIIILILLIKGNNKNIYWGFLWFLFFILPGFYSQTYLAADYYDYLEHRLYLPIIGILLMSAYFIPVKLFGNKRFMVVCYLIIASFCLQNISYQSVFKDGETFWKHAIEKAPEKANFHSVLGKIYFDKNEYRLAADSWRKAAELSETQNPDFFNNLAVAYNKIGRPDSSIYFSKKAIELDSLNSNYNYYLGMTLYKNNMKNEALPYLLRTIKTDKNNIQSYIYLISIYAGNDQIGKAIEMCKDILKIDRNHFHANDILGNIYYSQKKYDKAIPFIKKTIQLNPNYFKGYKILTDIYVKMKKFNKAKYYLDEIIKRNGKVPQQLTDLINNKLRIK